MITTATMMTITITTTIITAVIAGGIRSQPGYQTRGLHGGVNSH